MDDMTVEDFREHRERTAVRVPQEMPRRRDDGTLDIDGAWSQAARLVDGAAHRFEMIAEREETMAWELLNSSSVPLDFAAQEHLRTMQQRAAVCRERARILRALAD